MPAYVTWQVPPPFVFRGQAVPPQPLPPSTAGSSIVLIAPVVVLCLCTCQAFPDPPLLLYDSNHSSALGVEYRE